MRNDVFRVELKKAKRRVDVCFYFLFCCVIHRIFRLINSWELRRDMSRFFPRVCHVYLFVDV